MRFALITALAGISVSIASAQTIEYQHNYAMRPHSPESDTHFAFGHDASGNVTQTVHPNETVLLQYNHLNKIGRVEKGQSVTEHIYGADGNRIAKRLPDGTMERFFGGFEVKNSARRSYGFLGAKRAVEVDLDGSSFHFYYQDHLGSTSLVTNDQAQESSWQDYYEFGAVRTKRSDGKSVDFQYNDKRLDSATEFYDYHARFYASKFMKFTSADSIVPDAVNPQSWNRYAYVVNNPLRYRDPTGHSPCAADPSVPCGFMEIETVEAAGPTDRRGNPVSAWYVNHHQKAFLDGKSYWTAGSNKDVGDLVPETVMLFSGIGIAGRSVLASAPAFSLRTAGQLAMTTADEVVGAAFGINPSNISYTFRSQWWATKAYPELSSDTVRVLDSGFDEGSRAISLGSKSSEGTFVFADGIPQEVQELASHFQEVVSAAAEKDMVLVWGRVWRGHSVSNIHSDGFGSGVHVVAAVRGPGTVIYPDPDILMSITNARELAGSGVRHIQAKQGQAAIFDAYLVRHSSPPDVAPDRLNIVYRFEPTAD